MTSNQNMSSRSEIYASSKSKAPFTPFFLYLLGFCFSQLHNYNSIIHLVA